MSEIANLIYKLSQSKGNACAVFIAEVKSVDIGAQSCKVVMAGTDVEVDAHLTALDDKAKATAILRVPKVGSRVTISAQMGSMVVEMVEECDSVHLRGDKYTSLKGKEMVAEIGKLKATVDSILAVLNGTPIAEPGNGAPSALQTAMKAALTGKTTGVFSAVENKEVLHG